jgi:cytochrome b561
MDTQPRGYNGVQIGLHWTVATLVLFQLLFGDSMTTYVDATAQGRPLSQFGSIMASAHYWVGFSILLLVFIRLGVRTIYGVPHVGKSTPAWMATASRATHIAFYILLLAVPVSGLLAFYTWSWMGDVHAYAKPVFIVLIGIHAAAALFHHFILRDATLRNMLAPIRSSAT